MIKIIWNREDFEKIQTQIEHEFNLQITSDPNEVPEHKVGLLLKDENLHDLKALIERLLLESSQMLFPTPDGYVQIQTKQITFLEAFGEEIYMHLEHDSSMLIRQPLYQLEEKLKLYHFIRIGKSFIVNIKKIRYIRTSFNAKLDLELIDGTHLEVSRSFVKSFKYALGMLKKEES
ncbi:MAG: LytTR family DNA-binding domain-containing protein [Acholeplasmataceae bacterium]|jgi:DNA-binding LytR/AlgR family response regulator|nr:LytTR family DNA-binding domain-containing protein [Acholeplasmataceae bacterium]